MRVENWEDWEGNVIYCVRGYGSAVVLIGTGLIMPRLSGFSDWSGTHTEVCGAVRRLALALNF